MDSLKARKLLQDNSSAIAYVSVNHSNGDESIGTAFHVGEGVFVTAKHVLENKSIIEIKITTPVEIDSKEYFRSVLGANATDEYLAEHDKALGDVLKHKPLFKHWLEPLQIKGDPFLHPDEKVDLAVFQVQEIHHSAGVVKLGIHWDDWIDLGFWQLSDAIILGYPPIPMTYEPILIASRAEIHAYANLRHAKNVHFILSATPRGGFSGGAAIHESGVALGVVTSALVDNHQPEQLGFFAVLSVEPILKYLKELDLMPTVQKEHQNKLYGYAKHQL
jgi:hypothetical protein